MTTKKKTGTKTTTKKTISRPTKPAAKSKAKTVAKPKAPAKAAAKAPAKTPAVAIPARPAKPIKSPLNKRELEPYRQLLQELKQKLIKEVLLSQEVSSEGQSGDVLDLADLASDSYDKDLANSLGEAERLRLAAVEAALGRVEEGRYGLCEACGEAIPLPRLKVLPFAKLCVQCQQEEERSGRARLPEA